MQNSIKLLKSIAWILLHSRRDSIIAHEPGRNAWPDNREKKNPKPSTTGFGTYGGEALLIKEAHQMNNGPTPETRASGETGLIEGRS